MKKFITRQFRNRNLYIKYLIAGVSAAAVHISILSFFYRFVGLNIVISTSLGFIVSFYLQKFWTFRDNGREKIIQQMFAYLLVALVNMGINALFMYLLVEKLAVWYLLAQIIMNGTIAIESFLIYKFFIFKKRSALGVITNEDINQKDKIADSSGNAA